jgi:hypothetical protein
MSKARPTDEVIQALTRRGYIPIEVAEELLALRRFWRKLAAMVAEHGLAAEGDLPDPTADGQGLTQRERRVPGLELEGLERVLAAAITFLEKEPPDVEELGGLADAVADVTLVRLVEQAAAWKTLAEVRAVLDKVRAEVG